MKTQLPLPSSFDRSKVGTVYRVPYADIAKQAREYGKANGVTHASQDKFRVALLAIDVQNTFCLPEFELPVGGAVEDTARAAEMIYRNLDVITEICPTMDTHRVMQIFHPYFWVDINNENPNPGTIITLDEIKDGKWKVNPAITHSIGGGNYMALQAHAVHYAKQLSDGGKYPLMIWPYHSMLGGIGHALVSGFEEACFFHTIARGAQTDFQIKGGNPLTENYSIFQPEVLIGANGVPIAQKNAQLFAKLLKYDAVVIFGQAKSHCMAWAIDDILREITAVDKSLARKVYLVEDCTSPVVIPGVIDFTQQANEAFERFRAAGMNVVQSTTPMADWPGMKVG